MSLNTLKNTLTLNAKNLIGWRTNKKIVVFSVDDYGNVRLDSKAARARMDRQGVSVYNRFDALDTLETKQDLEALYEVLTTVRDQNDRFPVFTTFAVPCNINFEKVEQSGFSRYAYESLPQTFEKLSVRHPQAYRGTWELLKEGIAEGLMVPQFHGREHVNLKVFNEKLEAGDDQLLNCLQNRSFTSISDSGYQTISPMAAFDFWKFDENEELQSIIVDGLDQFEKVFGYRAEHFTPPVFNVHPILYKTLNRCGIRFVDTALVSHQHQGKGKFKYEYNYTGKTKEQLCLMVRNVVFEPTDNRGVDWISYAMEQIEAAFRWNRPAIISSHRVNFCGHIDEKNREKGLDALGKLLMKITERWPEVEFMSANEVGELIRPPQDA